MNAALPVGARVIQRDRAGVVSRAAADAIDLSIVTLAVFGAVVGASVWRFFFGSGDGIQLVWPSQLGLASLGGALLVTYLTWGWARTGRTFGKRLLGLAVLRSNGSAIGWARAFVRSVACVLFPIGLLWCAISRTNRSVQDVLVGTVVVYDWHSARKRPTRW